MNAEEQYMEQYLLAKQACKKQEIHEPHIVYYLHNLGLSNFGGILHETENECLPCQRALMPSWAVKVRMSHFCLKQLAHWKEKW